MIEIIKISKQSEKIQNLENSNIEFPVMQYTIENLPIEYGSFAIGIFKKLGKPSTYTLLDKKLLEDVKADIEKGYFKNFVKFEDYEISQLLTVVCYLYDYTHNKAENVFEVSTSITLDCDIVDNKNGTYTMITPKVFYDENGAMALQEEKTVFIGKYSEKEFVEYIEKDMTKYCIKLVDKILNSWSDDVHIIMKFL